MSEKLLVQPTACPTCPYLRTTPPGIWAAEEYMKLADFDEREPQSCARSACDNLGMHPHRDLDGLYCTPCAHRINRENDDELVDINQILAGPKLEGLAVFHCHQQNASKVETVCRGWLSTHRHSVGVRLAQAFGLLDPADIPTEPEPEYYSSGTEAMHAGLAGVPIPSPKAKRAIDKLLAKGAGKEQDRR